uniref:Uncharacterized protein n=1 Tax=Marseillevirus LCMAC201 TaxID=2506605 RepID=A0A481YW70_9VIRU|nr:MAG: protein of unknown function DUF1768 [Marseillevirus LCMAC201]
MTIFRFYSKSADKYPGTGTGENLTGPKDTYKKLSNIKDWRKMLSNFYIAPMKINDLTWNSVEHYFHAMKFMNSHPEFAKTFSAESNTDWSKDAVMAKSVGGKTGKYKGKQIRPSYVKMRPDFYDP